MVSSLRSQSWHIIKISLSPTFENSTELHFFFSLLVSNNGDASGDAGEQKISYDVSKLVDFPGFNVPTPHYVKDVSLQQRTENF